MQVLTPREQDVVREIMEGKRNKEIAESLGLGIESIKTYAARIRKKLGVRNRTAVAVWGMKHISGGHHGVRVD
jgi:DNA-binding CsgD family transcriptional regulator